MVLPSVFGGEFSKESLDSCLEKLAGCNDTEEGELESDALAKESEWERDWSGGLALGD